MKSKDKEWENLLVLVTRSLLTSEELSVEKLLKNGKMRIGNVGNSKFAHEERVQGKFVVKGLVPL